jgi:phospholipase/carboxylesterase
MAVTDPHGTQALLTAGPSPEEARGALILLHGRGASARSILSLYEELEIPDVAALAPQAAGHTWYPNSFLAPIPSNEPYLTSALDRIESIVADLLGRGVASSRIAILGFSQGACLTAEFAARHPRAYGALIVLTGGLIGPEGTPRNYAGSLATTRVLLASSDPDPHVPYGRVQQTAEVLTRMGAAVDLRRYPGMPHTINEEELLAARSLLQNIAG